MSYQLISAKRNTAGDDVAAGLSVPACSPQTPQPLADALEKLSHKLFCQYADTIGPVYSYRILTVGTQTFYILTAITFNTGSQEEWICHHTALTEEEMLTLKRNNARPTPAGIIYALQSGGHWYTRVEQPLPHIDKEPLLSASQLPDATAQPNWKQITGHKRNAAALLTPPYNATCLICCPKHVNAREKLLLLHEATWLMPDRGWGKTFCTESTGTTTDFLVTELVFGSAQSPQALAIQQTQHIPVLQLYQNLQLRPQDDAEAHSTIAHPIAANPQPQVNGIYDSAPAHSPNIYKYTEAPDNECFDLAAPCSTRWRSFRYIGILFIITLAVYAVVGHYADFFSPPPPNATITPASPDALTRFRTILSGDTAADDELNKLLAQLNGDQDKQAAKLAECIRVLITEVHKTQGHPENLLFLADYAESARIPVPQISRFYLCRAVKDYPIDEWTSHNSSYAALKEWRRFFHKHPSLKQEFTADSALQEHMAPIISRLHP